MQFTEGVGANSVTQETEIKRWQFGGQGNELILCDTQGIF